VIRSAIPADSFENLRISQVLLLRLSDDVDRREIA
jgi:hypothetical protein